MSGSRKILVLIMDGLGDLPVEALGGRTPLEAAATPVLDGWAARGQCGLVDPVSPGVAAETHTGTGTLMGLDADQAAKLDRGPIEAAGAGLDLVDGDVAIRANFATLAREGGGFLVEDRRAGRIDEDVERLVAALNDMPADNGVSVVLSPLSQHRVALRLSGAGLSGAITDTDPGADGRPRRLVESRAKSAGDAAAARTADALNRFLSQAFEVLSDHPVNRDRVRRGRPAATGLLTRGAGVRKSAEGRIASLGLSGAVVGGDRTVLGLGELLGFRRVADPAFTAMLDTDLKAKVRAARAALAAHDVVWLHAKGTDIASHDRQPLAKRDYLTRIDAALGLLEDEDLVIGVSSDHTTDSNTGRHTIDPVPTLLLAPGVRPDAETSFGESACRRGGLGRVPAPEFFLGLLRTAGHDPA